MKDNGKSPDPYLRAFMRKAVAIIAIERGFNDTSNAKLRALADQLGLSEETWQQAIEQLKTPKENLGLNRYELEFISFLEREFKKIEGDVVSIRAERSLVELATSKYQIDSIRAHQLIQKVASQSGVGIIAHEEARKFAQHLIEDAVGKKTVILDSDREQLYKICQKWGLQNLAVDAFLAKFASRNRWSRRRSILARIGIAIIGLAMLAGVGYLISSVDWDGILNPKKTAGEVSQTEVDEKTLPPWWDESTMSSYEAARNENPILRSNLDDLVTGDEKIRAKTYPVVIRNFLDSPVGSKNLAELIARIYCVEPNDVAAEKLFNEIKYYLCVNQDKPASISMIRRSVPAVKLYDLLRSLNRNKKINFPGRYEKIQHLNSTLLPSPDEKIDSKEFVAAAMQTITIDQWAHAFRFSKSEPKSVSSFLNELDSRNIESAEINELRTRTVQNILSVEPIQWQNIRHSITRSLTNSEQSLLNSWKQILPTLTNAPLREFISGHFASSRSKAATNDAAENQSRANLIRSAKSKIAASTRELKIKMAQSSVANFDSRQIVGVEKHVELGQLTYELFQLNNMKLALAATESSANAVETLTKLSRNPIANLEFIDAGRLEPTPSERRKLDELIEKLSRNDGDRSNMKLSAMKEIESLAEKFDDIDYKMATRIVIYLLQTSNSKEQLGIERLLPNLSHWHTLKLAFVDRLESAMLPDDVLIDWMSLIEVDTKNFNSAQPGIKQLKAGLIADCVEALENTNARYRDFFSDLNEQMSKQLQIRIQISSNHSFTPTNNLNSSIQLFRSWLKMENRDDLLSMRKLTAIRQHENLAEKILALNQFCIENHFRRPNVSTAESKLDGVTVLQSLAMIELALFRLLDTIGN